MPSRFPPAWLDELRARSDIVQVVSGYVQLKKAGHDYKGLCPIHGEKTASFYVDPEKQVYHCFGCGAGGNVIHFIMDMERLSFGEAVTLLAERSHLPLPEMENDEEYNRRRSQRERLLAANRQAARFYHETLFRPEGAASLAYLRARGLTDAVIRRFGLGAAPEQWSALTDLLTGQGFTLEELRLAGLTVVRPGESPGKPPRAFDMFRSRAMFPIIDLYGNVLAFGGRSLGAQQPKYLNTADTPVFNKRKGVFAANLLRKQRGLERVILVEGYMDVVSLTQFGVPGVCATLGTALTEEQARLLRRFAPQVYLAYDGDAAGQHAILRGLDILAAEGVPARVLDFPDGLDPDEFIRRDGPAGFQALPALSPAAYRLRRLRQEQDLSTPEGRLKYARAATAILAPLDPLEQDLHLKSLSVETGFSRETLLEQIRQTGGSAPGQRVSPGRGPRFTREQGQKTEAVKAQETLLSVFATGQIPEVQLSEKDFEDEELKFIYTRLLAGESAASILDEAPDEASRSRYSALLRAPQARSKDELLDMAAQCLKTLHRCRSERRRAEILAQLKSGLLTGAQTAALLEEAQRLTSES